MFNSRIWPKWPHLRYIRIWNPNDPDFDFDLSMSLKVKGQIWMCLWTPQMCPSLTDVNIAKWRHRGGICLRDRNQIPFMYLTFQGCQLDTILFWTLCHIPHKETAIRLQQDTAALHRAAVLFVAKGPSLRIRLANRPNSGLIYDISSKRVIRYTYLFHCVLMQKITGYNNPSRHQNRRSPGALIQCDVARSLSMV